MDTAVSRKRSADVDAPLEAKRARSSYYLKLASESSQTDSECDTESVHSIQNRETDVVRDTSDTSTKCSSGSDFDVEYELQSLSEGSNPFGSGSSGGSDIDLATAGAIAAAICDSSLETWITDGEESDNSSMDSSRLNCTGFWTCIQCKSQKNNPQFQYCEKCFQVRKSINPPRPKGRKRRRRGAQQRKRLLPKVELNSLRSCLTGLSQDSGLGSSQDLDPSQLEILNPKQPPEKAEEAHVAKDTSVAEPVPEKAVVVQPEESEAQAQARSQLPEYKELCIICNQNAKNSIFLHGSVGHMCCCYRCAMRTWGTNKRCPICQQGIRNVIKVFTF